MSRVLDPPGLRDREGVPLCLSDPRPRAHREMPNHSWCPSLSPAEETDVSQCRSPKPLKAGSASSSPDSAGQGHVLCCPPCCHLTEWLWLPPAPRSWLERNVGEWMGVSREQGGGMFLPALLANAELDGDSKSCLGKPAARAHHRT